MEKLTDPVLAWHFLPADGLTRYEPRVKVEVGQTLTETRPLVMCRVGLHGSVRAIDALNYAPGPIICRTRHSGEILVGDDKLCSSERTCLDMADATNLLHEFACWCAEKAMARGRESGREPDPRSLAAIEAKRLWLRGEISDDELDVASAAAWDAASAPASAAARAVASAVASAAAWAAAKDAASAAAWDVASAAASAAAWDAAWDAASAAAKDAAWDAARDVAWEKQNKELEQRLRELLGLEE